MSMTLLRSRRAAAKRTLCGRAQEWLGLMLTEQSICRYTRGTRAFYGNGESPFLASGELIPRSAHRYQHRPRNARSKMARVNS